MNDQHDISSQEIRPSQENTSSSNATQRSHPAAGEWERTFDAISDLIFIQDQDMRIVKVNAACARALNLAPEDIIGRKCHEMVHHLGHAWPCCPFEKSKLDNKCHTEEVNDPKLGIPLLVSVFPIFNNEGLFAGAVHIAKDISEIKKAYAQEQEHLHELEIFYKSSIHREERILELKEEVHRLRTEISVLQNKMRPDA